MWAGQTEAEYESWLERVRAARPSTEQILARREKRRVEGLRARYRKIAGLRAAWAAISSGEEVIAHCPPRVHLEDGTRYGQMAAPGALIALPREGVVTLPREGRLGGRGVRWPAEGSLTIGGHWLPSGRYRVRTIEGRGSADDFPVLGLTYLGEIR